MDGLDALVTGSSRGLGRGIAKALASAGARVWLVSEMRDELDRTADEIRDAGGAVEVRVADLRVEKEIARLAASVREGAERLRVVVNNAGVLERQEVESLDRDHWDRVMGVNLMAPVFLTRDLLPELGPEGGSVINVSSRAGILPFHGQTAYCASKFGVEAFTRCIAIELAGTSVSVNSVTPGLRIKPTSVTRAEADRSDAGTRASWSDPVTLGPAFRFLAGLRGELSGCRFDALRLTRFLDKRAPAEAVRHVHDVAEHVPDTLS